MRRFLIVTVLLVLAAVCAARAMEPERPDWVRMNPCFDNTDKWYAR